MPRVAVVLSSAVLIRRGFLTDGASVFNVIFNRCFSVTRLHPHSINLLPQYPRRTLLPGKAARLRLVQLKHERSNDGGLCMYSNYSTLGYSRQIVAYTRVYRIHRFTSLCLKDVTKWSFKLPGGDLLQRSSARL
ncbi:hypothetical protein N657DRAFT_638946 [Parathielavia appendiculata]|uniref:Uncharacterized protein n=1 Tax=Parathielavia appendiculata TaxID=2587402 RepID=A0AAN6U8Q5_9PEZI|nr:hypothetical protein N657DRAFT_638946 [Parathielavia appendiculata]